MSNACVWVLVMNAEADLQDAVSKLPESPPAMPTVVGHTDVRVQNQASCGKSLVVVIFVLPWALFTPDQESERMQDHEELFALPLS